MSPATKYPATGRLPRQLKIGSVMPCHAFTEKVLLLACGERIVGQAQVERLTRDDVCFSDDPPTWLREAVRQRQEALGIVAPTPERDWSPEQARDEPPEAAPPDAEQPTTFRREIGTARRLRREAFRQVERVLDCARAGERVDLQPVRGVVSEVVASLRRNRRAFASLLHLKTLDAYTYTHSLNTCVLSILLAKHAGMADQTESIGLGALVHDIGKVRLPDSLLRKPGPLSEDEWSMVKRHPLVGLEIAALSPDTNPEAVDAVCQHHERLDGSGYPYGLGSDDISSAGRMAAIADVYDAMTSDRPYHLRVEPPHAVAWLFQQQKRFDPRLLRVWIDTIGLFPVGSLVRLSTGEVGVVAGVNPAAVRRPPVVIIPSLSGAPGGEPRLLRLDEPAHSGRKILAIEKSLDPSLDLDAYLEFAFELDATGAVGMDRLV